MKRKFYKSCVALLLSMVMIFGGVQWTAYAVGEIVPFGPVLPPNPGSITIAASRTVMTKGETMQLTYSVSPSGGTITWSSNNASVATVSSAGVITAIARGSATISARYMCNGTAYTDSVTISVCDSVGISNNTEYYIMNASNDRLMAREFYGYSSTTNIANLPFSYVSGAKWRVIKQSNGEFRLLSIDGTNNNMYLGVSGTDAILTTSNVKFAIDRVTSGDYEGLYIIRYGNQYLSQNSNYDVCLTSTLSNKCYWSFSAVEKRYANYYSIAVPDTRDDGNFTNTFQDMGYMSYNWHCQTSQWAYGALRNTNDVFVFVGHGREKVDIPMATIAFQTTSGGDNGFITANNAIYSGSNDYAIDSMSDNDLALVRCVLYLGCSTGETYTAANGSSYNLVDSTFAKGAHFVLGTEETITATEAKDFVDDFLNYCSSGSIDDFVEDVLIDNIYFDSYYLGDAKQYLNIQ